MSRWVLPRSSKSKLELPAVLLGPHQMEIVQKRCSDTFGSLIGVAHGTDSAPFGIHIGEFNPKVQIAEANTPILQRDI
jgi:hypothetical protein